MVICYLNNEFTVYCSKDCFLPDCSKGEVPSYVKLVLIEADKLMKELKKSILSYLLSDFSQTFESLICFSHFSPYIETNYYHGGCPL